MDGADELERRAGALALLFLACVGVIGTILVFRSPPMGGFDEPFHWRRALQLADLHPLATRLGPNDWGGRLDQRAMQLEGAADQATASASPMSVAALRALSDRLARQAPERRMVSFPSTASFSPLPYVPAAAGILLARALHLGLLDQLHAGRLGNLAAYLLLVWCVVRVLPAGRLAALALLTTPTATHLAASFSADPLCNALPALLLAGCLRLFLRPHPAPPRHWLAGLLGLVLLLGLLKPICFVLCGLVPLVPAGRPWRVGAALGCIAVTLAWNLAYPFVPGVYWHAGADPHAAMQAMLAAPWHTATAIARNGWNDCWFWWLDGWGRYGGGPGPYHFTVPEPLATLFLVALLALAVAGRGSGRSDPGAALLLLLLALAYVAALLLAFRIGYGPPRSDFIDGVQGRYLLLPELLLLLALVLALPPLPRRGPQREPWPARLAPALLLLCLALDLGSAVIALGHEAALWN